MFISDASFCVWICVDIVSHSFLDTCMLFIFDDTSAVHNRLWECRTEVKSKRRPEWKGPGRWSIVHLTKRSRTPCGSHTLTHTHAIVRVCSCYHKLAASCENSTYPTTKPTSNSPFSEQKLDIAGDILRNDIAIIWPEMVVLIIFDGKSTIAMKHNHHVVSLDPSRAAARALEQEELLSCCRHAARSIAKCWQIPHETPPQAHGMRMNDIVVRCLRSWSACESKFAHLSLRSKRSGTDPSKK